MTIEFLIDSDVMIDLINSGLSRLVLLDNRLVPGFCGISVVTYGELLDGALWGRDPAESQVRTDAALRDSALEIIPITRIHMHHFAYIRGDLRRRGVKINFPDLLIAATALEHGLTVVTRNRRHFDRVPGLRVTSPNEF